MELKNKGSKIAFSVGLTILLVLASISLTAGTSYTRNQCQKAVNNFSAAHSLMITCILENSEPSKFCKGCVESKHRMVAHYQYLLNATDEAQKPCRAIYIDSHLHLIEDLYSSIMAVWNNAFCDDCWNADQTNLSDTTLNFYNDYADLGQCIKYHTKNKTVCISCDSRYQKLSKYYDTIRLAKANKICFDITDTVNKTRKSWSLDFKCCNDKSTDLTAFFTLAGMVGALPVIFYVVMFVYTRRTERDSQELLNDEADLAVAAMTTTTTDGPSTSGVSTREANDDGLKKRRTSTASTEVKESESLIQLDE